MIKSIERRAKGQDRRNALNDLPEPETLIIGQGPVISTVSLSIAKPLFEYRVSAELIGPDSLGHVGKVRRVVDVKVARPFAPCGYG